MVRANDGAVDHLKGVRDGPTLVQRFEYVFPKARQSPPSKLPVNAGPFAKLFRQVPPGWSGARDPENTIQNKAMIGGLAAIRGTDRKNEVFK